MNLVKFFLQHSRRSVAWSLVAGILSGACNAALLAVISSILRRRGGSPFLVWSFVGLCVLLPISRYTSELVLNKLGQGALYSLRMELSRRILAAPFRHLEQLGAARLLAALLDDVPNITGTILVVPVICMNITVAAGCLIYMGILSPVLLLLVLGFMVAGIVSYQLPVLKAQGVFRKAREEGDAIVEHFRALTQGTKELKIHRQRRGEFLTKVLEPAASAFRDYNISGTRIYTAAASWGQTLVFVVVGLILFVLPSWKNIAPSTLTGYTITLLYLMTPLQLIMNMLPTLGRANVALNSVRDLGLSLTSLGSEETSVDVRPQVYGQIEFADVTHTYEREGEKTIFALGPINLTFEPGEMVFITGGNGSGKTTFAKLLTGLYMPERGVIRVAGNAVQGREEREEYRQLFSVIFSDFYLFERLLGLECPGLDDRARQYLEDLKLAHKVQVENGKLSTIELSQGQRKRLALLTAYLEDRPVYLFDEWAADQDPYFKDIFYLQLLPELKNHHKTVFVITHDDRYYHVADRVIKLDEGQVVSDTANVDSGVALATQSK